MTALQTALMALDAFLTGKDARTVEHTMRCAGWTTAEGWLDRGREYYLSDGGYSRVVLAWQDYTVFLTSNSIAPVTERWPDATALVADVEREAQAELRLAGWIE